MARLNWMVLIFVMAFAMLGLSNWVYAEDDGIVGGWYLFESPCGPSIFRISFARSGTFTSECEDQDFIEEKGVGQDRIFTPGEDTLKMILEQGTYTVSGDSITLHITQSDIVDRVGITFAVTFSRTGDSMTFTNARELTFGYVDEEQVTLYDSSHYEDNEPFMGWWALYDPSQVAEFSPLFGIRLDRCGSFYSYGGDLSGQERGIYSVSGDSIRITIRESGLAERVGITFTVTFSIINEMDIVFTNAPVLTGGDIKEETVTLTRARTVVRPSTWGEIKSLFQ